MAEAVAHRIELVAVLFHLAVVVAVTLVVLPPAGRGGGVMQTETVPHLVSKRVRIGAGIEARVGDIRALLGGGATNEGQPAGAVEAARAVARQGHAYVLVVVDGHAVVACRLT